MILIFLQIHLMKFEGTAYSARELNAEIGEIATDEEDDNGMEFERKIVEFHQNDEEDALLRNRESDIDQTEEEVGAELSTDTEDEGIEGSVNADDEKESELIRQYCNQMKTRTDDDSDTSGIIQEEHQPK